MRADATRNRARILEVTRQLVSRDGPGVSTDEIAAEAGVAVGTLYRHFPTKAALIEAVVRDSVELLALAAEASVELVRAGTPAHAQLELLFRLVAARHSEDAAVKEAAVALGGWSPGAGGLVDFPDGTPERRAVEAIGELLAAAIAEGDIRDDLTVADLLTLVSGVPREPFDTAARDRYLEIVLSGVRRR